MKHTGWHTKHFLGGWKTLKTQPALLLIGPIASIIGLGALIDSTLYAFSFVFATQSVAPFLQTSASQVLPPNVIGPTLVELLTNTPLLIIALLVLFVSILCQTALIHVTHQHSKKRKKVTFKAAFQNATDQWLRMALAHLASFSAVFLLVVDLSWGVHLFDLWNVEWLIWPLFILDGLLILYVLTIKMLALQFIAGSNMSFTESVRRAWEITWRSPVYVLEHNVILFLVNLVLMTVLVFAIQILSFATTAIGTWAIVLFGNRAIGGTLELLIFLVGALFIAGLLTSYNFATWSHFAKNMEKRSFRSALRHLSKQYLRI